MQEYYAILGLPPTASIEEIKKAYRSKAKSVHPDYNKDPQANENFIKLTEAYNYLIDYKTKGLIFRNYARNAYKPETEKQRREKARQKARRAAQMHYEEYTKSEEYKLKNALTIVLRHFFFLVILLMYIVLPCVLIVKYGGQGVVVSVFILIVLAPFAWLVISDFVEFNIPDLISSCKMLAKHRKARTALFLLTNLVLIFRIGFQTMIPLYLLLSVFLALPVVSWILLRKKTSSHLLISINLVPLFLNILLLVNYSISFDPHSEKYKYGRAYQTVYSTHGGASRQLSTLIILENETYSDYPGIRLFVDPEVFGYTQFVKYTFKKGLLGLRIMTDYEFTNNPNLWEDNGIVKRLKRLENPDL